MSKRQFHNRPSTLDTDNDNNSEVSDVGPEDLANMVKGVDDMDDALFGFKPKQHDSSTKKPMSKLQQNDLNMTGHSKTFIKTPKAELNDFPVGDLLADISLSDDDFFDIGNQSPSFSTIMNKVPSMSPKKLVQDSLTKSKKIANLFGLDDEESDNVTVGTKKNQETAADWLGIKTSPKKTDLSTSVVDTLDTNTFKKDMSISEIPNDLNILENNQKHNSDLKNDVVSKTSNISKTDILSSDSALVKPNKTGEPFDLLSDTSVQKSLEIPKEKKSAIFDELFGDNILSQKKLSRRNSIVKNEENIATELAASVPLKVDGALSLGQYTPSASISRRPALGRRRETILPPTTTPSTTTSQEDWLSSSNVNDNSKTTSQTIKPDFKAQPDSELNDNLPVWLGGSGSLPETKNKVQSTTHSRQVETLEKVRDEDLKPATIVSAETKVTSKTPDENVVNTIKEVLTSSSDQNEQTALALQRTEVQLLAALELQSTQNSLAAVCARQRNILDSQERQLAQLVRRQTDRQVQVEKQMVTQQQRIQQLLEVFAMNISPSQGDSHNRYQKPEDVATENEEDKNARRILQEEVKKTSFENEELKMRISLTEKQYKFEMESLQSQHRREIEFLENQLLKQNHLFEQLNKDCKERISHSKEIEAEMVAQHNERVQRLKDERADDIKQLLEFHKITMDQVIAFGKLVPPSVRETTQLSSEARKPLDGNQLSEKKEELSKKEKTLSALQDKFEKQREAFEKQREEIEDTLEKEKTKNENIARQLKQEQSQFKYKQQQLVQEKKHIEEQYFVQRKMLEEMREKLMSDQTRFTTEQLTLAEERAKLDALAQLQGHSGTVSFDMLQAKAEVHGALEAARSAEMQVVEERRHLKEKERALDNKRWKLQEMEEDLVARAEHLDKLMQLSQDNQEAGHKALEEAKQMEKRADTKLLEVEMRKGDLNEKEQHLMRGVIDPKILILRLKAERELEVISKPKPHTTNEAS